MEIKNNKIIIGTAQFSNNYGLQNYSNTIKKKFDILNKVVHYKCHGIDTALNYDKSQKNIGNWLSKNSNKIKSCIARHCILYNIFINYSWSFSLTRFR